jgi:hypothetical protein
MPSDVCADLGERIRQLRKKRGWRQIDLAEQSGIHEVHIEVLTDVFGQVEGTVAAAAAVLAVSERQAYRLLARYECDGGSGLIHKARGRSSNRSFGPTLATEVLLEKHDPSGGSRDAATMDDGGRPMAVTHTAKGRSTSLDCGARATAN